MKNELYLDGILRDGVELCDVYVDLWTCRLRPDVSDLEFWANYVDIELCEFRIYSTATNNYFVVNSDKLYVLIDKGLIAGIIEDDALIVVDVTMHNLINCLNNPDISFLLSSILFKETSYVWSFRAGNLWVEGDGWVHVYGLTVHRDVFFRVILKYELMHSRLPRDFELS